MLVNGAYKVEIGNYVSQRATLDIPNEHLVKGENTVEIVVGAIQSSCGTNYDDFVLSDVGLHLLGEVADGEETRTQFYLRRRKLRHEHLAAQARHAHVLHPVGPTGHHRPRRGRGHHQAGQRHARAQRHHRGGRHGQAQT
ncbi:hypothetical protein GCM10020220_040510 [Nonomuraea rubra]